jgi:hypothetical protein
MFKFLGIHNVFSILRPNGLNLIQQSSFSKYISKSRRKRLPMTSQRAGKGYYKGKGARKEGYITSKGHFRLQRELTTQLIVPDLTEFTVKCRINYFLRVYNFTFSLQAKAICRAWG